jgi:hypothetical protein
MHGYWHARHQLLVTPTILLWTRVMRRVQLTNWHALAGIQRG